MFNQSISKFSSSKLAVAVSGAVLGLLFSSASEALTLGSSEEFLTGSSKLPAEVVVGANGTGIYITAPNVEINGDALSISRSTEPSGKTIYGLYALEDSTLSVSKMELNLSDQTKATPKLNGIYAAKRLDINSTQLKISISSLSEGAEADSIYGLRTGSSGVLSINGCDVNAAINLNKTSKIKGSLYGVRNANVFAFEGVDNSLNITINAAESTKIPGALYGIYNTSSGDLKINAKEINVALNVGAGSSGLNAEDPSPIAAIFSSGKNVSLAGEKVQIQLRDEGKGYGDRINYGIYATKGNVDVSSNLLTIDGVSTGTYIYGIFAQGKGTDLPSITLNSDTKIDVSSGRKENSYGLLAFAGGEITANGNIEVHANKAIAIRGSGTDEKAKVSKITVNGNGDKTVKLYGDIDFNLADSRKEYQNVEKAQVVVNLVGPESVWEGHTTITADKGFVENATDIADPYREEGLELTVTLRDNAKWIPNASNETVGLEGVSVHTEVLPLKTLVLDNGVIELTDKSAPEVKVTTLKGAGGEVHAQVAIDENSNITSNKLSIKKTEGTPSLAVHAKGITADDVKDHQAAMESFYANALFLDKEATANTQLHIPEGDVAGRLTGTVDSENNVAVQENPHTISSSVLSIASSNYLSFRSQINDVASRLGDLRSMPKTAGAWVRYYGGQNKYSDRGMKEDYNTIQIGGDGFIADKYYLGGTFSYTDGNGTLVNGSSDDKNYNFGIYGGWLGEKGQFVDVIVKRHRIKSDFDLFNALGKSSGSYRTWGTSASIEAGWRLQCPANGFYAEPQAEFMLGHVESVNYKTNRGVRIHQDGINSAIGRVGIAFGYTFSENKGNAYAKASVLHDWKGDVKASYSKDGVSRRMHDNLGGTWGEFAVGATYNPIKNLSAYGQFKTTTGSPIRTPWQASIGVRYSF